MSLFQLLQDVPCRRDEFVDDTRVNRRPVGGDLGRGRAERRKWTWPVPTFGGYKATVGP